MTRQKKVGNLPIEILERSKKPIFLQSDKEALYNYKCSNLFVYDLDEKISDINDDFFAKSDSKEYKSGYIDSIVALLSNESDRSHIPFSIKLRLCAAREKISKRD
jgi:hypothetical protein